MNTRKPYLNLLSFPKPAKIAFRLSTIALALAPLSVRAETLDLQGFLNGVEQSRSFNDLTQYLRTQPLDEHSAFGLLSSIDGTPRSAERPQVISKIGNVWSGMGGKFYDVIIASGDAKRPFLYFQLTEGKKGLIINDDPTLTVAKIRSMPPAEFISWNGDYGKKECYSCHKGRLLIELEDQPRRFSHEDLRFKDSVVQNLFSQAERSQLERFLSREKGPRDVRYAWIYSFLSNLKSKIKASDLFNYRRYKSEILHDNAKEAYLKISSNEKFGAFKSSLIAALANRDDFSQLLARASNRSESEVQKEFEDLTLSQARSAVSFKQTRNMAILNGAFDQASPEIREQAARLNLTGALLLNEKAIIDIGPRLQEILLSPDAFAALPASERRNFVSTESLAVTDSDEILKLTELGRERMAIRAKFSMVAKYLATDKFSHLAQMSSSIRPSTETQGDELNSLDLLFDRVLIDTMGLEPSKSSKRKIRELSTGDFESTVGSARTQGFPVQASKVESLFQSSPALNLSNCREAFPGEKRK